MRRFTSSLLSFFKSSSRSFFSSSFIVIVLYRVRLRRLLICIFRIFLNPGSMRRSHSGRNFQIQVQLSFLTVHFIKFDFRIRIKSPKFSSWNSRSFNFLTIDISLLRQSSVEMDELLPHIQHCSYPTFQSLVQLQSIFHELFAIKHLSWL